MCQLLLEHLSFLQNLMNFIITKYLKQEVDDNLSLCMVEGSPCGPSITGDIKIYQGHVMKRHRYYYGEVPYRLLTQSCFYCRNLIAVALLYLEIRDCHVLWDNKITTAWGGVPNGTFSMMFTCCPNLMFLASLWLYKFSNWSFCYFERFKVDVLLT